MKYKGLTAMMSMFAVLGTTVWPVFTAQPARAAAPPEFSMNRLISDDEFVDFNSLSAEKIQSFLDTKSGILKSYVHTDGRTAAQIIFQAAQTYTISPKVILTNIQKESSMITRTVFPAGQQYYLDWIMFYGVCDSCSPSDPNIQDLKGFANQIEFATKAFRRYLDQIGTNGYTVSGWGPAISKNVKCIDSDYNSGRELCTPGTTITITPSNAVTAALYTYTPHPGGNYGFWTIWRNFSFNLRRFYPDGSLLRTQGTKDIYLVQNGLLRHFANQGAFLSRYSANQVIDVPADHLWLYESGRPIAYANYTLLKTPSGGIYLLVDDIKRPVTSMAAFRKAGWRREEIVKASWADLNEYQDGVPITPENIYPSGQLLQNKKTGTVWYVKDGIRYGIPSKQVMRSQFGKRRPTSVKPTELETYTEGALVGFKDGELIAAKSGGPIYVISNGYRLPIASRAAFDAYRFNMKNVIRADDRSINAHPEGALLDVESMVRTASR